MSGGGGSGGMGPAGPRDDVDCARLQFDTTLTSPVAGVVDALNEGDTLELEIRQAEGGRNMIAALSGGQVAGAITDRVSDLLRCMQDGYGYAADVLRIDGGWIELRIRHS